VRKKFVYLFSVACNEFDNHTIARRRPVLISDLRKVCDDTYGVVFQGAYLLEMNHLSSGCGR
jgi:hypothetical protein